MDTQYYVKMSVGVMMFNLTKTQMIHQSSMMMNKDAFVNLL